MARRPTTRPPVTASAEKAELARRRRNERAAERTELRTAADGSNYRLTFPTYLQHKPKGWSDSKFGQARNLYADWVDAKVRLQKDPTDVQADLDRRRSWVRLTGLIGKDPSDRDATALVFGEAQEWQEDLYS